MNYLEVSPKILDLLSFLEGIGTPSCIAVVTPLTCIPYQASVVFFLFWTPELVFLFNPLICFKPT